MNFLAHAWLSGENEMVLVANVTGDAFKGNVSTDWPIEFQAGLHLHRYIDRLTDTHADLKQASAILKPFYGRYSGVALDIWLDHILARDFETHHPESLRVFTQRVYTALQNHEPWLNVEAKHVARFMIEHDWLYQYAQKPYAENVLHRMAMRFKAPALSSGGHPDDFMLADISLIFNNIRTEIQQKTKEKLVDLLNE